MCRYFAGSVCTTVWAPAIPVTNGSNKINDQHRPYRFVNRNGIKNVLSWTAPGVVLADWALSTRINVSLFCDLFCERFWESFFACRVSEEVRVKMIEYWKLH